MERSVTTALIQYEVQSDWSANMDIVAELLKKAREKGAELAILPEIFNMPYDMSLVPERAEAIPDGRTCQKLSGWAKDLGLVLVGGSMAEIENDRYYNTATIWSVEGELLARHRKMHLFDVDLPGGVSFKESSILAAGDQVTVVDVLGLKMGVAVCYDVRFPELFRLMADRGAEFVALPGAFNNVSGPAHWELLLRNRAIENTFYVAGVSGTAPEGGYHSWGHSMLVGPFGDVLTSMGRSEGVAVGRLEPDHLNDIRARLPVFSQRRLDLYRLTAAD